MNGCVVCGTARSVPRSDDMKDYLPPGLFLVHRVGATLCFFFFLRVILCEEA